MAGGVAGALADGVAVLHALVVVLVVAGGLLAWRWRAARAVHLPVLGGAAAVNATGSPCPLTEWELHLRAAAGEPAYSGGFLGHYLVEPLPGAALTPAVSLLLLAGAVVPNAVAYGVPLARALSRRRARPAAAPARCPVPAPPAGARRAAAR